MVRRSRRVALARPDAGVGCAAENADDARPEEHLLAGAVVGARVRWRVEDRVAGVGVPQVVAPPLERVVEPEKVADFVHRRVPQIVGRRFAAGQRGVQQEHAVRFIAFGELVGEHGDPPEGAVGGLAQVHVERRRIDGERVSDLPLTAVPGAHASRNHSFGVVVVETSWNVAAWNANAAPTFAASISATPWNVLVFPPNARVHVHLQRRRDSETSPETPSWITWKITGIVTAKASGASSARSARRRLGASESKSRSVRVRVGDADAPRFPPRVEPPWPAPPRQLARRARARSRVRRRVRPGPGRRRDGAARAGLARARGRSEVRKGPGWTETAGSGRRAPIARPRHRRAGRRASPPHRVMTFPGSPGGRPRDPRARVALRLALVGFAGGVGPRASRGRAGSPEGGRG